MKKQLSYDIHCARETDEDIESYKEDDSFVENGLIIRVFAIKNENGSVSVFKEKEKTNLVATYPSDYSSKPTKKNKYVMLNCSKYRLIWV